jgi:hypothetical protein
MPESTESLTYLIETQVMDQTLLQNYRRGCLIYSGSLFIVQVDEKVRAVQKATHACL